VFHKRVSEEIIDIGELENRALKELHSEQFHSLYYSLDSVDSVKGEVGGAWGKV
jgi:hypothetical protein